MAKRPAQGVTLTRRCAQCGVTITTSMTAFQRVTGFAKKRSGGGANAIALAEWSDEWLCKPCVDTSMRTGVRWEQQSLWDS